jgi:hypothetical protein
MGDDIGHQVDLARSGVRRGAPRTGSTQTHQSSAEPSKVRIGLVPDGMPDLPLPDLRRTAAELRFATLELGCGHWPSTPHLKRGALLNSMLDSVAARNDFLARLAARDLSTSVQNCSGTPLRPSELGSRIARPLAGRSAWRACSAIPRVVTISRFDRSPDFRSDQWTRVRSCG